MSVTIRDVAKLAGISVTTASAALNGTRASTIRVSRQTKLRVQDAAAKLGYVPNAIAKSLATGKSGVIGMMLPYADAFIDQNPFCNEVMVGIIREVVHRHYNLMMYTATSESSTSAAAMIGSRVDGLLLVMPPEAGAVLAKCERSGIPYVSVLRVPVGEAMTVNSDDREGGRMAARHLAELGHKRIAHLKGDVTVLTSAPRLQGFRAGLEECGVALPDDLVVQAGFDWRLGYEAMQGMLAAPERKRPTAIFAANDLCAEGAMRAIREAGMRIPEDMAVVGYDDTWYAAMTQPPLTSVHMPIAEMGEIAARMLVDTLEGCRPEEAQPVLPVWLNVRKSCGAEAAPFVAATGDTDPRRRP